MSERTRAGHRGAVLSDRLPHGHRGATLSNRLRAGRRCEAGRCLQVPLGVPGDGSAG